jgi:hypothetical protein
MADRNRPLVVGVSLAHDPIHRRELPGWSPRDDPAGLPEGTDDAHVQDAAADVGALFSRLSGQRSR